MVTVSAEEAMQSMRVKRCNTCLLLVLKSIICISLTVRFTYISYLVPFVLAKKHKPVAPLFKVARPLNWRWQNRSIRNVTAFPKLYNLSLAFLFLDHCKCCIGEVDITLCTRLESASPPNHVHEAALVAIGIGNAERVDKAVFEGRESHA
jgi:hypothetical protein